MWDGVPGHVERTIQSLDFPSGNIAVVLVTAQFAEPVVRRHETFIAVKESGSWYIRVHRQTAD